MEKFMQEVRQNLEEILRDVKGCEEFLNSLRDAKFPWEILDLLDKIEKFDYKPNHTGQVSITGPVYFGKDVKIKPFSVIEGPAIIYDYSVIGPLTHIRPMSIIGRDCTIGSFTVFKNSIILDNSHTPHFNYVGDSIIGRNCNFGAGSKIGLDKEAENNYQESLLIMVEELMQIWKDYDNKVAVTSNLKLNEKEVKVHYKGESYYTGRRKLGAIMEDNVKVGCNVTINPGSYIDKNIFIAPGKEVSGHTTSSLY